MKPLIQVAISALSTTASVDVMAIITGILLFIKSRKTQNHCNSENKSLSDRLECLGVFAEDKQTRASAKKISVCMPSPPTKPMFSQK